MKKIDMSSKKFGRIKKALSWTGLMGGAMVFDSVVMPFTEAALGKHRIIKLVSDLGVITLSSVAGMISFAFTNLYVDSAATVWNGIADRVNANNPVDIPLDDVKVESEGDEKAAYSYTFFGDDADVRAHDIVLQLENIVDEHGVVTVNDLRRIQHRDPVEDGDTIGWTQDDLYHSEIETLLDSNNHVGAVLTLSNPHDISEHYVVIKPSGEKKEEEE